MFGRMEMLCSVFVLRGIAAADMAAVHAQTQMHPLVAGFQALFTPVGMWNHTLDLSDMFTLVHTSTLHPGGNIEFQKLLIDATCHSLLP
jgi:hypothetical protein